MSCNCNNSHICSNTCNQPCTCQTNQCACPVLISSDCVNNVTEDLTCSNILKGQTLTEVLLQLDAFICTKFETLANFLTIINVGSGAEVFKGANLLGKKQLRSLVDSNLINIVEGTDEITISVDEAALDAYIEANQLTYTAANVGTGASLYAGNTTVGDNTQFNLRKLKSSDSSVTITEGANEIDLTVEGGASNAAYVIGWQLERQMGSIVTVGQGVGQLTLTNGSNAVVGIGGVDFNNNTTLDSPFYQGQATIILPDGSKRFITFSGNSDGTNATIGTVYADTQSNTSIGSLWDKPTGDYSYYPYFVSEASGKFSHAEGSLNIATGDNSHAEGNYTTASAEECHAEGYGSTASGIAAHAEGDSTTASGDSSHAEGKGCIASGARSHAEGYFTTASGFNSHAEGTNTSAGNNAHAQGSGTQALGNNSHAGGVNTTATGLNSFVHGSTSTAVGDNTVVLGANITGTDPDKTYVDNFNIKTLGVTTPTALLGRDVNGNVVTVSNTLPLSGTYTPVASSLVGLNSITALNATYTQIGNIVHVQTMFNIVTLTPTVGRKTFLLTLPVARTATANRIAGSGVAEDGGVGFYSLQAELLGSNTTQVQVIFFNPNTSSSTYISVINYQYSLI